MSLLASNHRWPISDSKHTWHLQDRRRQCLDCSSRYGWPLRMSHRGTFTCIHVSFHNYESPSGHKHSRERKCTSHSQDRYPVSDELPFVPKQPQIESVGMYVSESK
jgi:hypothetical protein